MSIKDAIASQFLAALDMLKQTTGELMERLGTRSEAEIHWVSMQRG